LVRQHHLSNVLGYGTEITATDADADGNVVAHAVQTYRLGG
jgi:hypothetical protein